MDYSNIENLNKRKLTQMITVYTHNSQAPTGTNKLGLAPRSEQLQLIVLT